MFVSDVRLMTGFPTERGSLVTLANWQDAPFNRWAFQHLREVIPTQRIPRGMGPINILPWGETPLYPETVTVQRLEGRTSTLAEVFADTWTDAVVIMHDGRIVFEHYENEMAADTPHLMMSVTKSVVGCVAGILTERGLLSPEELVTTYVPEVEGSGYSGATVRNLLDMRTGVGFREEYTNAKAEVRVMERYMGWRP
jgi:CubicO group peptidase (beta-lactamase class C family)